MPTRLARCSSYIIIVLLVQFTLSINLNARKNAVGLFEKKTGISLATDVEQISHSNNSSSTNSTKLKTIRKFLKNPFRLFKRVRRPKSGKTEDRLRKRDLVKNQTLALTLKMQGKLEEARRIFLDRMAAVSFVLINQEHDATMRNDSFILLDGNDDDITPQSDLNLTNRSIFVVTTAALPWRTGTSVNPLLRAAYLSRRASTLNTAQSDDSSECITRQLVTLVIPWLELEEDRAELYGPDHSFPDWKAQEHYIREWLRREADMEDAADEKTGLRILFYPARYHSGLKSIFAMGDIISILEKQTEVNLSDAVCILEEPEHLNWYRAPGMGWTKVFNYVVGIVHTNYVEYASTQFHGLWTAPAIQVMSSAMIRAYCHKVIKLSGVLQTYAPEKEITENVHGVRQEFINEGRRRANSLKNHTVSSFSLDEQGEGEIYFVGKILWAKGFDSLLELEDFYHECTGQYFAIDIYGSGPDEASVKRAFHGRRNGNNSEEEEKQSILEELQQLSWDSLSKLPQSIKSSSLEFEIPKSFYELRRKPIPATFQGPADHATLRNYKVFVNPSVSEVLCTTTFEALAMNKFVIIPFHESNKFFLRYPNCLAYRNKWEFVANLRWALTHEPEPLTSELADEFTWAAATERLIRSSAITRKEARQRAALGRAKLDERIEYLHNELGKGVKGDALRKFLGGGPVSHQVQYELSKQGMDEENSENEGLTYKFNSSSFVRAIKSSIKNIRSHDVVLGLSP